MPKLEVPPPERRPAVITGASSGIGAATALTFAAAGYPVALGARRVDKLDELAAQIRETGGEVAVAALDVTDADSVEAVRRRGRPTRSATSRPWSPTPVPSRPA